MQSKLRILGLVLASCSALYLSACEGAAGIPGEPGAAGATGVAGADGAAGDDGADGADGEDGTDGAKGNTGATGPGGTNGKDCTVQSNGGGSYTIRCSDGTSATVSNGSNGSTIDGLLITDNHGEDYLLSTGEYALATNPKYYVQTTIMGAWVTAGSITTVFKVMKGATPVTTMTSVGAGIAKLEPAPAGEASNRWVNYIYGNPATANAPTSSITCITRPTLCAGTEEWNGPPWNTPKTAYAVVASRNTLASTTGALTAGKFKHLGGGVYVGQFSKVLTFPNAATVDGQVVTYDPALTHRVTITSGGHSGPTGTATYDFVPAGGALPATRNIVDTAVCYECHNKNEFHGHGGDRLTVQNCVTCHNNPGLGANVNVDIQARETMDMKVMLHKFHAGAERATAKGANGTVWDNDSTGYDNNAYVFWGNSFARHDTTKQDFPAGIETCGKCHQQPAGVPALADLDNWKTKLGRDACGSCHDDINWTTGANHGPGDVGGPQATDTSCATCHTKTAWGGPGVAPNVVLAHDWTTKDPRNLEEFTAAITVSTPGNGQYFVNGEKPVVWIQLRDAITDLVIDHTTFVETGTAQGCLAPPAACPARDGLISTSSFFVHGPRAERQPVLTSAARAWVLSGTTGPWNLSAANATLALKVDNGQNAVYYDATGGDKIASGTISVAVPATGTFANKATATADEVVTWLNGNTGFSLRAVAWKCAGNDCGVGNDGKVAIRSRNLGKVHAIQLTTSVGATQIFAGDLAAHLPGAWAPTANKGSSTAGGSTVSNVLAQRTTAANEDPKVTRTAGWIRYELDAVNDLVPGTYVASFEISDRGRKSATDYATPTVGKVTFQVKQTAVERPVADSCNSCHQGPDSPAGHYQGLVVDPSRHNKQLTTSAVDQCGACHDYLPQALTGVAFGGAKPIAKRVHAVHRGADLMYPLITVDYSNGDPMTGRNWAIHFPQDILNCQACHNDTTSSGTWATKPNRLACMGCHDKDAATAHIKGMTYDPTPADAWSGDEEEACAVCH